MRSTDYDAFCVCCNRRVQVVKPPDSWAHCGVCRANLGLSRFAARWGSQWAAVAELARARTKDETETTLLDKAIDLIETLHGETRRLRRQIAAIKGQPTPD